MMSEYDMTREYETGRINYDGPEMKLKIDQSSGQSFIVYKDYQVEVNIVHILPVCLKRLSDERWMWRLDSYKMRSDNDWHPCPIESSRELERAFNEITKLMIEGI